MGKRHAVVERLIDVNGGDPYIVGCRPRDVGEAIGDDDFAAVGKQHGHHWSLIVHGHGGCQVAGDFGERRVADEVGVGGGQPGKRGHVAVAIIRYLGLRRVPVSIGILKPHIHDGVAAAGFRVETALRLDGCTVGVACAAAVEIIMADSAMARFAGQNVEAATDGVGVYVEKGLAHRIACRRIWGTPPQDQRGNENR